MPQNVASDQIGSGGSAVDNTLDYQSRNHKINPPLHQSFKWDFKQRSSLRYDLIVGGFTHSLTDQIYTVCLQGFQCNVQ